MDIAVEPTSEEPASEGSARGEVGRGLRPGEIAGVVVPVVALVAVVAAAATGTGLLDPGDDLGEGTAWAVRAGGLLLVVVGLVALAVLRRRGRSLGPDGLPTALVAAAAIFAALTVLTAPHSEVTMGGSGRDEPVTMPSLPQPPTTTTDRPSPSTPPTTRPTTAQIRDDGGDLMLVLVTLVLAALAMVAGIGILRAWGMQPRWRVRRAGPPPTAPEAPGLEAPEAEAGLTASLAVVLEGDDPRSAIVRAYATLLDALTEAGAWRRPEEAPHEHLHRVLGPLGVRPEPVHALAELFVLARFSSHAVTDQHRNDAATWLQAALDDLHAHAHATATAAPPATAHSQPAAGDDRGGRSTRWVRGRSRR